MLKKAGTLLTIIVLLFGCSASQETTETAQETKEPEVYVFDDVTDVTQDTTEVEPLPEPPVNYNTPKTTQYYVQVGAFTSRGRAEQFVKENAAKLDYIMDISYSDDVKLHVVQLPPFNTRAEAETVRNRLWQTEVFKDAFILTK